MIRKAWICRRYSTFSGPDTKECATLHYPKSCGIGMAISWTTMFAFEPRLVAFVVGKPKLIVAHCA